MTQRFVSCLNPRGFHKMAYYVWGRSDAPRTIVCVHGLTRNAHDFAPLAAALSADARIISVDVAGRGASDNLPDPSYYSHPQYMADLAALLARLDVTEVDWIGTSMGGLIGITMAAQPGTPIRRLILNDIGPLVPAAAMARISSYVSAAPSVLADMAAAEVYFRNTYQHAGPYTDSDVTALIRHGTRAHPDGGLRLAYDPGIAINFAAHKGDVDLWPFYDKITCPTMVMRGAISEVLTAATATEMTQRGPRACLETIPGIGHYPMLMDAAQIATVRGFLKIRL